MLKKKKFLIGGIIVFLVIGYLVFLGLRSGTAYYYQVNELLAQGSSVYDQTVRVNGQVAPGSLQQEAGGFNLKFTIVDVVGGKSIPVVYRGVVPDSFKVGNEVVVEGRLDATGIFQAQTLMPKCPSKYVPKV